MLDAKDGVCEDRTHDLRIMGPTRYRLRQDPDTLSIIKDM